MTVAAVHAQAAEWIANRLARPIHFVREGRVALFQLRVHIEITTLDVTEEKLREAGLAKEPVADLDFGGGIDRIAAYRAVRKRGGSHHREYRNEGDKNFGKRNRA